mgnify:CR=1 FL=1
MKLKNVSRKWDYLKTWEGRYKKFKVQIGEGTNKLFGSTCDYYYFVVNREEDDISYNSLWTDNKYNTLKEAEEAAIKWIDEKLRTMK